MAIPNGEKRTRAGRFLRTTNGEGFFASREERGAKNERKLSRTPPNGEKAERREPEARRWKTFLPMTNDKPRTTQSIVRAIRALPLGNVSTYGAVARAAGWPGAARQVVRVLRQVPGLPWHRVLGSGGAIKLPGESGAEQRFRLRMEGVAFRGARVDMKGHEFKFPSAKTPKPKRTAGAMRKPAKAPRPKRAKAAKPVSEAGSARRVRGQLSRSDFR